MSGGDSWAITEPSTNSTSEWTIDCGWTTTSICSRLEAEQPAGLDDFQGLVHHRGRVDRDFRSHVPGRMRQCLLGGDASAAVPCPTAKRPAAGRQHDAANFTSAPACLHGLKDRAVFAVDGDELAPRFSPPVPSPAGLRRPMFPCSPLRQFCRTPPPPMPLAARPPRRFRTGRIHIRLAGGLRDAVGAEQQFRVTRKPAAGRPGLSESHHQSRPIAVDASGIVGQVFPSPVRGEGRPPQADPDGRRSHPDRSCRSTQWLPEQRSDSCGRRSVPVTVESALQASRLPQLPIR